MLALLLLLSTMTVEVILYSPQVYSTYSTEILIALTAAALVFFFWMASIGKASPKITSGTTSAIHASHDASVVFSEGMEKIKADGSAQNNETAPDLSVHDVEEIEHTRRLRVLKNLLKEGLISEDDYNAKKEEIIKQL